jgi:hypothetical protein
MNCAGWLAFGQTPEAPPKFKFADVHASAKGGNQQVRSGLDHGDRYVVKNASMADLVGIAYGFETDKVWGGPNWLEMDRFDVIAKVPADATAEADASGSAGGPLQTGGAQGHQTGANHGAECGEEAPAQGSQRLRGKRM